MIPPLHTHLRSSLRSHDWPRKIQSTERSRLSMLSIAYRDPFPFFDILQKIFRVVFFFRSFSLTVRAVSRVNKSDRSSTRASDRWSNCDWRRSGLPLLFNLFPLKLCYSVTHAGNRRSKGNYSNFTGIERRTITPFVEPPRAFSRPFTCQANARVYIRVDCYATRTSYTMACGACRKRNLRLASLFACVPIRLVVNCRLAARMPSIITRLTEWATVIPVILLKTASIV